MKTNVGTLIYHVDTESFGMIIGAFDDDLADVLWSPSASDLTHGTEIGRRFFDDIGIDQCIIVSDCAARD